MINYNLLRYSSLNNDLSIKILNDHLNIVVNILPKTLQLYIYAILPCIVNNQIKNVNFIHLVMNPIEFRS